MPIYEYECSECGERFERMQRIGDVAPVICPHGHARTRRLLSHPAIIFRGSGFYVTDHGRNGSSTSHPKRPAEKPAEPSTASTTSKETAP
ncbi:MAG TPA: zinc ribbon domain-containing protein [Anaerolineae bacterium]|nr:zinc ribbon domain-containing protein [Anaerolineae bacterium]